MHDTICDVIDYFDRSCDMGKISVCDKIVYRKGDLKI